jgi:hypothetical protein
VDFGISGVGPFASTSRELKNASMDDCIKKN